MYRPGTSEEIKAAQELPGAPHVCFMCKCGEGPWFAKNLTLTDAGGFNGCRNIFYSGEVAECACAPSDLYFAVQL